MRHPFEAEPAIPDPSRQQIAFSIFGGLLFLVGGAALGAWAAITDDLPGALLLGACALVFIGVGLFVGIGLVIRRRRLFTSWRNPGPGALAPLPHGHGVRVLLPWAGLACIVIGFVNLVAGSVRIGIVTVVLGVVGLAVRALQARIVAAR